jgi:hypothetical protein
MKEPKNLKNFLSKKFDLPVFEPSCFRSLKRRPLAPTTRLLQHNKGAVWRQPGGVQLNKVDAKMDLA